jgi:outer membrane protein assembly factor BamB
MMGLMVYLYSIPVMSLALVAWAMTSRGVSIGRRRVSLAAAILLACGALMLARTNGVSGDAISDLEWRWTPTAEERLLASAGEQASASSARTPQPAPPIAEAPAAPDVSAPSVPALTTAEGPAMSEPGGAARVEWSGFRGAARDSVIRGVRIDTDWSRTPPVELWRQPIGPGWSSFAVAADRFFTQEQRGDEEIVSAYDMKTGTPVWKHRDAARFWESNAGAGPRATPTLHNGRVYTLGGTGILNALDARDGSGVWTRNVVTDTGATIPDWGIASSPLVVGDVVVAAAAGSLAAYDLSTGKPRWFGPKNGWGYSSPQLMTIDGVAQIVLIHGPGVIGVSPSDGAVLWKHEWPGDSIVQPAIVDGADLLIASGSGLASNTGMLRINVAHADGAWSVKQRWTSMALKPYFNDFVVHREHAYGFDGGILAAIDVADGTRKWKGGRYGHGQLVLLPEQNLLLVLAEDGELALVSAMPDKFMEIARIRAIEGKTWNHPVLAGDVLLVRNGEEMAAFRLSLSASVAK